MSRLINKEYIRFVNEIKAGAYQMSQKQKQHNFECALPVHLTEQTQEAIKSVYNLAFLDIKKPVIAITICQ